MAAETFRGCFKRHACLQGLFSDCAKGMHACGNIFRKVKCCSVFPGAKDSVCYVRLMSSSEGRKSRRIHGPPDRRTITWPYSRLLVDVALKSPEVGLWATMGYCAGGLSTRFKSPFCRVQLESVCTGFAGLWQARQVYDS